MIIIRSNLFIGSRTRFKCLSRYIILLKLYRKIVQFIHLFLDYVSLFSRHVTICCPWDYDEGLTPWLDGMHINSDKVVELVCKFDFWDFKLKKLVDSFHYTQNDNSNTWFSIKRNFLKYILRFNLSFYPFQCFIKF